MGKLLNIDFTEGQLMSIVGKCTQLLNELVLSKYLRQQSNTERLMNIAEEQIGRFELHRIIHGLKISTVCVRGNLRTCDF